MAVFTGDDVDDIVTALAAYSHDTDKEKQLLRARYANDYCQIYDPNWNLINVRACDVDKYLAKTSFRQPSDRPTCAVTGTAIASGVLESEIVTGSETLILTLTKGTWKATLDEDDKLAIVALLDGSVAAGTGFDAQVVAAMDDSNVERTSATVVTVTLPAAASYAITGDETVTIGDIPAGLVVADGTDYPFAVTPSPASFVITNES